MERVRKVVQALWVFLANGFWGFPVTGTLYQGPLKVVCSPGLNCYSCPAATTFCPIGSLQQLLLGVRLSLQSGQLLLGTYVLGCMGLLGTLFGRFICGWACPFGLLQELLYAIPTRKYRLPPLFRFGKYLCLVLLVIVLPLTLVDSFGLGRPWFCKAARQEPSRPAFPCCCSCRSCARSPAGCLRANWRCSPRCFSGVCRCPGRSVGRSARWAPFTACSTRSA
jgi:hypothetical protein